VEHSKRNNMKQWTVNIFFESFHFFLKKFSWNGTFKEKQHETVNCKYIFWIFSFFPQILQKDMHKWKKVLVEVECAERKDTQRNNLWAKKNLLYFSSFFSVNC
jgi:hypothetical protein